MTDTDKGFEERAKAAAKQAFWDEKAERINQGELDPSIDLIIGFQLGARWGRSDAWDEVIGLLRSNEAKDQMDMFGADWAKWLAERKPKP